MSDLPAAPKSEPLGDSASVSEREAVGEELRRILESPEFHSSPRCQEFLKYVVEQRMHGAAALLKERNIGVDVFHRRASYEPNTDAIVRVRATEVRKRLALYYDRTGGGGSLRIVLEPGTYVPEFRRNPGGSTPQSEPAPQPAPRTIVRRRWWIPAAGAAALALFVWAILRPQPGPLREFWAPTLKSPKPVVICVGQPVVYHLSRRVHEKYLRTQRAGRLPGPYVIPLKPGDIDVSDILPVPDQYVGAGTAQAAARLSALLAGWGKQSQIRVGNDFSFYDLRNSPAVLEGAYSNDWTIKLSQSMPFSFFQENGVRGIREKGGAAREWRLTALNAAGQTTEDYALTARVFDSGTLEPLIMVAGITQYGTHAAGEFLADERSFAEAMKAAPPGWQTKNIQVLLHVNVLGKVPGKPEVVAVKIW